MALHQYASAGKWRRLFSAVLATLTVVVVLRLEFVRSHEARYVIIHADDAGMYSSVNRATIQALERGSVSSTSIMVPCPGFADFAAYATYHPEKDFGVHLTLNCDTSTSRWGPVAPRDRVASLLDPQGFLWSSPLQTARYAKIDEVELELRFQIEKALRYGVRLSHLDHHMFVLSRRDDFFQLYVKLGLEYGLAIRIANAEESLTKGTDTQSRTIVPTASENLPKRGFPILADLYAENYELDASEKRDYFLNLIRRLPPGVSEIVVHCAKERPDAPLPPDVERRTADTRLVMSGEFAHALSSNGIQVIDWRQFRRMERQ